VGCTVVATIPFKVLVVLLALLLLLQLLGTPKVLLFPFFSVGVNLFFISLLDKYQNNAFLNPLFQ
jgi:hypothetical protein